MAIRIQIYFFRWSLKFRFLRDNTFAHKVHVTNADSSYKTECIQVCHIFFSAKDLNIMWL